MTIRKLIPLTLLATSLTAQAPRKVDFIKDVEPLLAEKCHSCHGPAVQQAGLRLDRRQQAMRGGDYGPVIIPGKSAESKLIKRLLSGDGGMQMPPTGGLTVEEIELLRAWIDQGADFRLEVKEEAPPKRIDPKLASFITAVRGADRAKVEALLKADSNLLNGRDPAGSTPLHHAAGFGSVAIFELLIDRGADVNAKNRRGSTPLHWGIHDLAKVRLLLAHGAAVNAKQAEGRTPLYQAASLGDGVAIMKLLLDKGADPNLANAAGGTPLMAAATDANVEGMQLLVTRGANVHVKNGTGATALFAAAASGSAPAVKLLLEKGADPNVITKRKATALGNAATSGVEESVSLLLAHGAKVNVADDRGYTPLMFAAASDAIPTGIVKLLLDKGADPAPTAEGETAGSLAAKRGNTEVARLLGATPAVTSSPIQQKAPSAAEAATKAVALLEKQSYNFIRIGGCNSCHAQDLPSAAAALARDRGLRVAASIPQLPESGRGVSAERIMDQNVITAGSIAWELFDFGMNRIPKNDYTDAVVRYLKSSQKADGHWHTAESRRPPMSSGDHQTAALAVYSLQHFDADSADAIARTAAWFEQSKPVNTQDRAFHLLGLAWSKAKPDSIKAAARALAGTQRQDGGWSQLPTMQSDAYATGQALYALTSAGNLRPNDPVIKKAVAYLLGTQASDGSWHVATRSIWFQPYFESGFPYGHDQWISAAGTAWATMALAQTLEPPTRSSSISRVR